MKLEEFELEPEPVKKEPEKKPTTINITKNDGKGGHAMLVIDGTGVIERHFIDSVGGLRRVDYCEYGGYD